MLELKKAAREQVKIKIGLAGSAGSGKTASSLLLGYGIVGDWSKIALIDTENRSSELYAGAKFGDVTIGDFNVIHIAPPFTPEKYIEAMDMCLKASEIELIILDSMSQEWDGKGGVLEIHTNMPGNSFTNWGKLTPRHNRFIDSIIHANKFVICTMRTKQDYVLVEKNGKQVPEKVGLKAITREGVDYEFTLVFDIDIKHHATSSKDRTNLFMDKPDFVVTPETGMTIKKWCESGVASTPEITPSEAITRLAMCNSVEELKLLKETLPATVISDKGFNDAAKARFKEITTTETQPTLL